MLGDLAVGTFINVHVLCNHIGEENKIIQTHSFTGESQLYTSIYNPQEK